MCSTIRAGRSRYVLLLNERGHVIDDGMIVKETDECRFVLTFTTGGAAGTAELWMRDWIEAWGLRRPPARPDDVAGGDQRHRSARARLPGPGWPLARGPARFLEHVHADPRRCSTCHVMRLSFTGEASFELHHPVDRSVELWQALLAAGQGIWGIAPHGLQALFALRLEKGHVIIGMDTELDTTPRRLGMDWAVNMDKLDFNGGRPALARTAPLPDHRKLVGLTMPGTAPTEGAPGSWRRWWGHRSRSPRPLRRRHSGRQSCSAG